MFAFPLFKPIGKAGRGGTQAAGTDQPVNTASFIPFGKDYRGGVSLATGWLAGSLGGAKRIVVSQLADGGSVKIFSSGSALDGGPSLYLQSPCTTVTAPTSARSRASSRSTDLAAHGWPRPARRRAPTCWSAVLRRRHGRKRSQIRVRQTERTVDDTASRASRTSLVRKRVAACHPRRRLVRTWQPWRRYPLTNPC